MFKTSGLVVEKLGKLGAKPDIADLMIGQNSQNQWINRFLSNRFYTTFTRPLSRFFCAILYLKFMWWADNYSGWFSTEFKTNYHYY